MNPSLLLSIISGEASAAARRARRSAIEYVIAAVAAIIGFAFLLVALYIYAAQYYGELQVALVFGAVFLALAVLMLIYHRLSARARARRARHRLSNEAIGMALPLALAFLPSLMSKRGALLGLALPVVSALAYVIYRENSGAGGDDDDFAD